MSKVRRSVYQKVAEENKRLLKDIRILVEPGLPSFEKIMCMAKWRTKFEEEKEFNDMIKEALGIKTYSYGINKLTTCKVQKRYRKECVYRI